MRVQAQTCTVSRQPSRRKATAFRRSTPAQVRARPLHNRPSVFCTVPDRPGEAALSATRR